MLISLANPVDQKKGNNVSSIEITEVLYGMENAMDRLAEVMSRVKNWACVCGDSLSPSFSMGVESIKKGYIDFNKRGIKTRFITEITKANIHYCKELMKFVELRHMDNVKGNMAVSETEYVATAVLQGAKPVTQTIYSNTKAILEQHSYFFENLWNKAMPAEHRIREIEEGMEPIKTKVLENKEEIYNYLIKIIKRSKGRLVCYSIGGMQMIYNNFFYLYRDIIERQKRGEGNGIKWLTHIDDNKDNIKLIKEFVDVGIQVRHIKNLPSMNFSVDSNSIQATIEGLDKGEIMNSLLVSNEPAYVKHFTLFFNDLWSNHGIDAVERIKDIEEGMEYDIDIIRQSDRTLNLYLEIVQYAQSEIFFIFPTPRAFIRQLKAIYLAKQVSKERQIKVRILTPSSETVEARIENLLKMEKDDEEKKITKYNTDSFSYIDIKIKYIEKMSNTKATILVIDRKESLVMELKDDSKDTFIEAIGLSIHSTSKASVLSYVAIFENLWKQSELFSEIKESNENLRMTNEKLKINDNIQKEFINTAAHELRTPIQPIMSLSDLLKNKIKDKEQKELLDIILKNAKKLKKLTEDILDVTKIEGNKLNLSKKELLIVDLLQSLIKEFEIELTYNKKIKFELDIDDIDKNTIAFADRNRISQVILNLINNSIKFILIEKEMDEDNVNGLISISVEKIKINDKDNNDSNTEDIIISIKDNGTGIDSEIYPRLFTKFASKSFQGTGLGLFISKNIIEAHGGKIWAKNNEDGKGATFSFSLPIIK